MITLSERRIQGFLEKFMSFIIGFFGACLGLVTAIGIIIGVIYFKTRKFVGPENMKTIVQAAKNAKSIEQQEYTRVKNVSGITKLIEPTIIRDFNDFNKDFLFSKVESNMIKIFNSIEDKDISKIKNDNDLIYIYPSLREKIIDLKNNNINIKYDEVKFHAHAIKDYLKSTGKATIKISSTVEYYYTDTSKSNNKKEYNGNLKKQTRYTTEFVYVYDESKFKYNENVLVVSCPNCGAPLGKLGAGNCYYCGTYVEPVNLKNWYMVSYKEDY